LSASFERTRSAFDGLWDEETRQYCSRDAVTGTLLRTPTVATFLPLYAGVVPSTRITVLADQLRDPSGYWPRFPVPTVPTTAAQFREQRYWKGPTWVNTNWLVIEGLRAAGEHARAAELRDRTLDLVGRSGFWEYFSPLSGEGFGAPSFSWTAALTLDLLAAVRAP
jgi:neutral trehalase